MEHISSRFNGNLTKEWRTHLHAQNSGHSVEILSLGKFTIFQQNFLVIKNENFTLTKEIIRQINSLVIFFSNNFGFTKFLPKDCESISEIQGLR